MACPMTGLNIPKFPLSMFYLILLDLRYNALDFDQQPLE